MVWNDLVWDGEESCVPPHPASFVQKWKIANCVSTSVLDGVKGLGCAAMRSTSHACW